MKFSEFSEYLEKLEATSSRLTLIEILSELFRKTPNEEIEKIVYLIQGRIAPFFAPLEIGMAEKNVASSIAIAFGSEKEKVLTLYRKLGDMGKAAQELAGESKSSNITVSEVFDVLTQISKNLRRGNSREKTNSFVGFTW
jgi:DNA ligase-1